MTGGSGVGEAILAFNQGLTHVIFRGAGIIPFYEVIALSFPRWVDQLVHGKGIGDILRHIGCQGPVS